MSVRGIDTYCPVNAERICEEEDIECPWLLRSLGEDADTSICPVTPQLDELKNVLRREGIVE